MYIRLVFQYLVILSLSYTIILTYICSLSDQQYENPISELSVMVYMFPSAEHSVHPRYLPSYKPSVSNQLSPCTACT